MVLIKSMVERELDKFMVEYEIDKKEKAFELFSVALYSDDDFLNLEIDQYYSDIVDGSQDKQIDAINISENDTELKVRIFQIKTGNGFKSNDVILIRNGVDWILNTTNEQKEQLSNSRFLAKINEVMSYISDYGISNVEFEVFYITLGNKEDIALNDEVNQEIEKLDNYLKQFNFKSSSINLIGYREIYKRIDENREKDKQINAEFSIVCDPASMPIIEKDRRDCRSVVFTIKGKDIAKLVSEDPKNSLFDKNVRKYLKKSSAVNKDIIGSCSSENSDHFWYLNNGITMVCDDFQVDKRRGEEKVTVKNLQIVNGCQTSVSLYHAYTEERLNDDVELLLRIHAVENSEMYNAITIATNNQNPIDKRDLHANEEIQVYLERYYGTEYGLYYERKRSQYTDLSKGEKKKIIKNDKLGQAFLAVCKTKPAYALSSKSKVFNDEYSSIFTFDNADKILLSYLIWKECESFKKKNEDIIKHFGESSDVHELLSKSAYHNALITSVILMGGRVIHQCTGTEIKEMAKKLIAKEVDFEEIFYKSFGFLLSEVRVSKPINTQLFTYLKTVSSNDSILRIITKIMENTSSSS